VTAKRNKQSASHNGSDGSSSGCPRIVYTPNLGTTPEVEACALAAVYGFILKCYQRNATEAEVGGDENATETKHAIEQPKERHAENRDA
jgi:hypothetical protein